MSSASPKLGYPDLDDPQFVYNALVGYGLFSESLPPCFTSKDLTTLTPPTNAIRSSFPVLYGASRHNHDTRPHSIPHPGAYLYLCQQIRDNWKEINTHIGKPDIQFSRIHVRKIDGKNHIFEMSPNTGTYGIQEPNKNELDWRLNCKYVAKTDISSCFPSIYTHSIKWAATGNKCNTPRKKGYWPDELDGACGKLNDSRTKGIPIGPHASNIISEIILTAIDCELQSNGFKKVARYIDDYIFYAKNQSEAKKFFKQLGVSLKSYELAINTSKTKILPTKEYHNSDWKNELNQHKFATAKSQPVKFDAVNAFIELALRIHEKEDSLAPVKYAMKIVQDKRLSDETEKAYIKRMLALANLHPYLLPTLESYVLPQPDDLKDLKDSVSSFSKALIKRGLQNLSTDALAFGFYFAIKYDLDVLNDYDHDEVIKTNDCVAMTLAYEYVKSKDKNLLDIFHKHADKLCQSLGADRYWLFIYQVLISGEHNTLASKDPYLEKLKEHGVKFLVFPSKTHRRE